VLPPLVVVWMSPGSGWDPAVGPREQRLWPEHAAFMDDLFGRGLVVLGGPLADGCGSLVVVRADSIEQVRAEFSADPWSVHDVLPVRDVRSGRSTSTGGPGPADRGGSGHRGRCERPAHGVLDGVDDLAHRDVAAELGGQ
jgi:uncharacterized protein